MDWLVKLDEAIRWAHGELDGGGGQERYRRRLQKRVPEAVERIGELEGALASDDAKVREAAARVVGAMALGGRHPAWLLGALAAPARVCIATLTPALAARAAGDSVVAVRRAAMASLIEVGGDALADAIAVGVDDGDEQVQDLALAWLARRGDRRAAPLLLARLAAPAGGARPIWESRRLADSIAQTRMIGIAEAGPLLARWLDDADADVRQQAAEAAAEHLVGPDASDAQLASALAGALHHADRGSIHAALALARRPELAAMAVPALAARLAAPWAEITSSLTEALVDALVLALAAAGGPDAAAAMLPRLVAPWSRLRIVSAGLLGEPGRAALREALRCPEPWLRTIAARVCTEPAPLREIVDGPALASEATYRDQLYDRQLRAGAALALAALDLAAIDERTAAHLAEPWSFAVDSLWDGEGLSAAVALDRLAGQLAAHPPPPTPAATAVLAAAGALLDALDAHLPDALLCYRGRGGLGALCGGLVFFVADRLARAAPILSSLRPRAGASGAPPASSPSSPGR